MIIKGSFNDSELEFLTYNFEVKNTRSICFKLINFPFEHISVIVRDPLSKIRGLFTFKTRQEKFVITNSSSSNLFNTDVINDGIWTIEVARTYKVDEGFELCIEFNTNDVTNEYYDIDFDKSKIYNADKGWYSGDLHMHSNYSDGRVGLDEVCRSSERMNLDFISITEHNVFTTKYVKKDYPIIPATEVTWDNDGHYNAYNLKGFIDYGKYVKNNSNKNIALDEMFSDLKNDDVYLSLNHPFSKGKSLGHDIDVGNFKFIEVINAPHLAVKEIDNDKAIKLFDYLWLNGIYLYGIGGSDSHKCNYKEEYYPIGLPTNRIHLEWLSIENILNSMLKGNLYVQLYNKFELDIESECKSLLPGDRVDGNVTYKVSCDEVVEFILYKNGKNINTINGKNCVFNFVVNENDFYRVEAIKNNEVILFTNPVHNMTKEKTKSRTLEIIEDFNKSYGGM